MEIFEKENESYDKDEPYEELIKNEYNEIGFKKIKFSLFKEIISKCKLCIQIEFNTNIKDLCICDDYTKVEIEGEILIEETKI